MECDALVSCASPIPVPYVVAPIPSRDDFVDLIDPALAAVMTYDEFVSKLDEIEAAWKAYNVECDALVSCASPIPVPSEVAPFPSRDDFVDLIDPALAADMTYDDFVSELNNIETEYRTFSHLVSSLLFVSVRWLFAVPVCLLMTYLLCFWPRLKMWLFWGQTPMVLLTLSLIPCSVSILMRSNVPVVIGLKCYTPCAT